jgi:hypothetical protein
MVTTDPYIRLSSGVARSRSANRKRGQRDHVASLAVVGSERRKKGEGVGAPFPPYSLSSPDPSMGLSLWRVAETTPMKPRLRRHRRIAEPTRPRCPATKTYAPLSTRKEGSGSVVGEIGVR